MFTTRKRGIMSFSGKIKASIALLMAVGSCAMAAKSTSGKVVDKLGDAKLQKSAKIGEWNEINYGIRVKEKDQIRTGIESIVALLLPDGSSISVQENSLVEFATLKKENETQVAFTDVKTGKVKFEAQKQLAGASFKFKTATAVVAIRGTHGFFGRTPAGSADFLSIGEGRGTFKHPEGNECDVTSGHIAFVRKGSTTCHVIAAKSSGSSHYLKLVENLLDNTKKSDEQIISEAKAADAAFQADVEKAKNQLKCQFDALEDTITTNSVTLKGACNAGVKLTLAGKEITDPSSFEFTTTWAPNAEGPKKFNATCSIEIDTPCAKQKKNSKPLCKKEISADCGLLTTYYKNTGEATTDEFTEDDSTEVGPVVITTPSPAIICDSGSVTVEGTFDQTDPDATLFVKMKNYTSRNLVPLSANGEFSHTITINDILRNWNETEVIVEYQGKAGTFTQKLELDVQKSCKQVNMLRPTINFISTDSVKCKASFSILGASEDLVILTTTIDGGNTKESTFTRNTIYTTDIAKGVHKYTFTVEDQAGNKSTLKKTLGCYPLSQPKIVVSGPNPESISLPPPPPNSKRSFTDIHRIMRFRISDVPQHNATHISKIKVVQSETNTLLDIRNDQITELDYNIPVTLPRSTTTKIKIYVEMKNGRKIIFEKIYEVD